MLIELVVFGGLGVDGVEIFRKVFRIHVTALFGFITIHLLTTKTIPSILLTIILNHLHIIIVIGVIGIPNNFLLYLLRDRLGIIILLLTQRLMFLEQFFHFRPISLPILSKPIIEVIQFIRTAGELLRVGHVVWVTCDIIMIIVIVVVELP